MSRRVAAAADSLDRAIHLLAGGWQGTADEIATKIGISTTHAQRVCRALLASGSAHICGRRYPATPSPGKDGPAPRIYAAGPGDENAETNSPRRDRSPTIARLINEAIANGASMLVLSGKPVWTSELGRIGAEDNNDEELLA